MKKTLVITPSKLRESNGLLIRSCELQRYDDDQMISTCSLFYSFPINIEPPEDNDCDSYLLAVIFDAMREQRNIEVLGSVSRFLMINMREYQGCWAKWLPKLYKQVDIKVEKIREDEQFNFEAVCAFSGGVDATFSVWRNYKQHNDADSPKIKFCSFIQGCDIPLSDNEAFSKAFKTANETLKDINLDLIPIHSNIREISGVNWEDSHASGIISCLSNFKKMVGTCVLGSSAPYEQLMMPWGSSPVIDHLLSSGDFLVMHDGATHNRIEKVKEISQWEIGSKNLRVCWEGNMKDRNCGKCEKCIRTKLNFLITNKSVPHCFPDWNEDIDLTNIRARSIGSQNQWKLLYKWGKKEGLDKKLLTQISRIYRDTRSIKDILLFKRKKGERIRIKIKRLVIRLLNLINPKVIIKIIF